MSRLLKLNARYVRLYADDGKIHSEENYKYADLQWEIPLDNAAVICIDCWDWHHSLATFRRIDKISRERIAPLLESCRNNGLQVIHAPADPPGKSHPNYIGSLNSEKQAVQPDWPPPDFICRRGEFAGIPAPFLPCNPERIAKRNALDFHPAVCPVDNEPVIVCADELQQLCSDRKIMHLFFTGFSVNACLMLRDYGIPGMVRRGYNCILLRDCTTGMESADTLSGMICTRGAVNSIEQMLATSIESSQLIAALDDKT